MSTLDFTSTSADGLRQADDPLISLTTIVANLGSHPAVTVPLITGEMPDVNWTWDYLEEPADFFGIAMPAKADLRSACERFAASATAGMAGHSLLAVTIMLIEANGRVQFVITGVPTRCLDPTPVRIAVSSDAPWCAPTATDPVWRRMSACTTSKGDVDQLRRWLNGNCFVDLVNRQGEALIGPPALGALVFDTGSRLIGLENSCPTSILELMARSGVMHAGMVTGHSEFAGFEQVRSAWWISPRFGVHPVEQIGDTDYEVEFDSPPIFLGSQS
jgi:hypothetical protein